MPFVSITRLRLRSVRFLPGFAWHALRTQSQLRHAAGFLDGALLPDRRRTFWTMTMWDSAQAMRDYILAGAHKSAMSKLAHWCDEAAVAHWDQDDAGLPSWLEADQRLRQSGRTSKVRHPGPDHATMAFAPPMTGGSTPIRPAKRAPRRDRA